MAKAVDGDLNIDPENNGAVSLTIRSFHDMSIYSSQPIPTDITVERNSEQRALVGRAKLWAQTRTYCEGING